MLFRRFEDPASGAISYLLADPDEREAALIDPRPAEAELLLALLAEHRLHLRYILRTHAHDAAEAACGRLCSYRGTRLVLGQHAPAPDDGAPLQRVVDGELLVLGFEVIRVIATPGHTPGCMSYLWRDRLFCGDALEIRGCPVHADTDPAQLWDSVTQRLFALPDETLVFPGHDFNGRSVSTIGEERRHNPAFASETRESFVTRRALRRLAQPALQPLFPGRPAKHSGQ